MVCRGLVLLLLVMGVAAAQDQRSLARQKFDEGRQQFAAQHFGEALALFEEAYRLAPYPDLLFNIGRCHQQLGNWRKAYDAYQRYLAVNPSDEEVRRRAEEMHRLDEMQPEPPEPSPTPTPQPQPEVVQVAPPPVQPVYRKWWLWTAVVGVVAVGLGVGLGVGLSHAEPDRSFPPLGPK